MKIKIQHLAGALALAAFSLPAAAQVSFQSLGTPGGFVDVSDMSADGSAFVATSNGQAYLWTTSNPIYTPIPGTNGVYSSYSVSNGGLFVCGTMPDSSGNDVAARWSKATGQWTLLGGLVGQSGTSISSAYDISEDGSVVVGLGWVTPNIAHAFRWDPVGGLVDLGTLAGALLSSSRADGVSADGTTITGFDSDPVTGVWRGVVWTNLVETQTGSLDPADPIDGPSQGFAVSATGTYVVGESSTGLFTPSFWNENHAFRYDTTNGLLDLGTTPVDPFGWGNHATIPTGVSADGRTVVGLSGVAAFGPGAVQPLFIWNEGYPMMLLSDYLVALGATQVSAWTLERVAGISSNGRVLYGHATNNTTFAREVFKITIPTPAQTYCTAKINSRGCYPAISVTGFPNPSSNSGFVVKASNVLNNKNGLLFYGVSGRAAGPFQFGTLCVRSPIKRSTAVNSGGVIGLPNCTGVFSLDMNAFAAGALGGNPLPALRVPGTVVDCQWWGRDPGFPAPNNSTLSDAVEYMVP